jgi:preprotein translocase subunit YajC
MKFIKKLMKFIIVIALLIVLILGIFIFLIYTPNTEMPENISKGITNDISYSNYLSKINLSDSDEISENDINSIINGTMKQFENSLFKVNYAYADISEKNIEFFLNVTPKIQKYKLDKLNMEFKTSISLSFDGEIAEVKIIEMKVSKLKLPKFAMKEIILFVVDEVNSDKIKYFDEDNMVILLDFSNLFFKKIELVDDAIFYELIFEKEDIEAVDVEIIIREKFNKLDFMNLESSEKEEIIILINKLSNEQQSETLQYLKENLNSGDYISIENGLH